MQFSINKSLENINFEDIKNLINNQIQENIYLDYKRDLYGKNNGSKKELLKDISAFANSHGGDLIIGIEEDKYKQAFQIVGFTCQNIKEEINRIEQIINAGLEPKLNSYKLRYIKFGNDKYLLIIRVYPSPLFPHMISFQRTNKFYVRKSDKNLLLDAYELRNVFSQSENFIEKIRKENSKRIFSVSVNDTIVPIVNGPKLIINLVPYAFLENQSLIDFSKKNISLGFPDQKINFDGILGYKTNNKGIESYCQMYRNGIIEFVTTSKQIFDIKQNPFNRTENIKVIFGNKNGFEQYILNKIDFYLSIAQKSGISIPIFLFISIINAKNYRIMYEINGKTKLTNAIDRDLLQLPELELKHFHGNLSRYLESSINMIWNACGEKHSAISNISTRIL